MPTARELLEQADALMRRNRGREVEPDIPELTDEVAVAEPEPAARRSAKPPPATPAARRELDDVPELTDAVGQIEEVSIEGVPDDDEESRWFESELGGVSVTGPAPDSIAVVPPSTLLPEEPAVTASAQAARPPGYSGEDKLAPETAETMLTPTLASPPAARADTPVGAGDPAFDAMLGLRPEDVARERELAPPPPVELTEAPTESAAVEATEPAAEASDVPSAAIVEAPPPVESAPAAAPSWEAVAEEIRMQVLQRIDIFTDTGLQGELAARLQPIVDRASADLVATINREVGQLLRAYVAEAIEREIEKWRELHP